MSGLQPAAGLEAFTPIIGRWASQGETVATQDEPSVDILGTDVYTWIADGHFIEHRVHVRMGDDLVEALEVIGGTEGSAVHMRSFDNEGTYSEMRGTVNVDGAMTFAGDGVRTTLTAAEDGQSMQARWERSENGHDWTHWMDMRFTRI